MFLVALGKFRKNKNRFYRSIFFCDLPVVHELSHEFEDGCGAGWVVVPQLDGSLQNGHVGGISAGLS